MSDTELPSTDSFSKEPAEGKASPAAAMSRPLLDQPTEADVAWATRAQAVRRVPSTVADWEFPGWGVQHRHKIAPEQHELLEGKMNKPHSTLSQLPATAICGNDITSSCLYVAGIVTSKAGQLAPFALILVAFVLYIFRKIYAEVVTALPLNGGAYNALLNTTTKGMASLAACLAILSYIATGVVSASEACSYIQLLWPELNVTIATVALLFLFAMLTFMGLTESAVVATVIFLAHLSTLLLLCVICAVHTISEQGGHLADNWRQPLPPVTVAGTVREGTVATALFFGLCASLLGVSGFETSSQFVEEQAPGVFVKTLRNMWTAVAFFNPLLAFLSICVLPLSTLRDPDNTKTVLGQMGRVAGGEWLQYTVSIDAFVVLSGAVLTSYVGVTGLMRRMAMDRCLPQMLLHENAWRGTNHYIIFGYFFVSSSLFLILHGNIDSLSNIYTVSFLAVMALFAIGCMLLKYKRPTLPRDERSTWIGAIVGLVLVIAGIFGNLLLAANSVIYLFLLYFGLTTAAVVVMFQRLVVLKLLHRLSGAKGVRALVGHNLRDYLRRVIRDINETPFVFFTKRNKISVLNKAVVYVRNNEQTNRLLIVHCHEDEDGIPEGFVENVQILDNIYPKLSLDFVTVHAPFGPGAVQYVSEEFNIPHNMMFITCPDDHFPHRIAALGGVRVITHS